MTGIVGDPTNWKILRSLEPEFVRTLRLCCLFGEEGTEALLVDDEDEVWAFGPNKFGRLGIGLSLPIPGPVKVFALCGRTVSSFAYGEQHVIALTKTGLVFGWGNNERQQVVPGGFRIIYTPTVVYDEADPAVEIACGKSHSACRTREGAVYYWGNDSTRTKVGSARKYIQISCLESSTLAVCENGEVHKLDPLNGWNIITSRGTIIRKIAGGKRHALAVSADGQLYVWGANSEHQLGLDHSNNVLEAVCHSSLMNTYGRIVDIAVSKYDNVSAVTTERSEVLFWGHSPGPRTPSPIKVPYESMQDVFATISRVPATPVALIMPTRFSEKLNSLNEASSHVPRWESSFLKAIAEHFDNPDSSDVKFRVGEHTIHAHKVVLKIQSEYFREMLEGPWEEDQSNTIEVKTSSYAPYRAFLRYFYTGEVELPAEDMPELLNLANSCCEDQLKILCEKRFESTISIDNCASVYSTALRCRATDLQNFCLKFAAKNLPAVSRTSAHEALTDEVARKFLEGAAKAMDS